MKARIIQPAYAKAFSDIEGYISWELSELEKCDETLDIVVFPESTDSTCRAETREQMLEISKKYSSLILDRAAETARRISAIVVVNVKYPTEGGLRNSTCVFGRNGEMVGRYDKQHLTPGEVAVLKLDSGYTYEYSEPYVIEIEGLRFGFLTCYDFYFYEMYPAIARKNVDIIIGCSHQRSDSYEALEIINRFLCYHTNAYLLRASVSMGDEGIGGCSCVVSPRGEMLGNLYGEVGSLTVEFDPKDKYYKPAGYLGPLKAHYEYIEMGRRPWKYRPSGSATVPSEADMPYPRTCAHRGFSAVAPENTMPAFGAAVAMGAEEIEFDVWASSDGVLVSCHDSTLDRVSNGHGLIYEHTFGELMALDFGAKAAPEFQGLRIATFGEILKKLAGQAILNIHVKIWDMNLEKDYMQEIVALVRKYDCEKTCYFMTVNDEKIKKLKAYAPDLNVCLGWNGDKAPNSLVDRAIALGVNKVQLYRPYFNAETVRKAHANGILCNVFWADEPDLCREYLEMGIDTILTNDYNRISQVVEAFKREKMKK